MNLNLRLKATAIGSLPHKDVEDALNLIFNNFSQIPFWPQLAHINKLEDMISQYTQNIAGIKFDEKNEKFFFDNESDEFFVELEDFYDDFEQIVEKKNHENLEKYAITPPYSISFSPFLKKIASTKPEFAKGHIIGPFTWATSLSDSENKCAFYDDVLRDIIVKACILKALWQIEHIKSASKNTTPIIFLDEPALSQYGTSAFITVQKQEVIDALKQITTAINENGAISAIHCCGKADWALAVESGVKIINLDGYFFAASLALESKKIENFLKNGGFLAWGIVPTLDKEALTNATSEFMLEKFEDAISHLTKKGVDKNLILNQSLITPSCGAGSLDVGLAVKAMNLTSELAKNLTERFGL